MTFEDYAALDRANFSSLRHFARSPAHYLAALNAPHEDTDALRLGRVTHVAIFEPERLDASVAIWTNGDRRGNAWKEFAAANAHREILKPAEWDTVRRVADAVRTHPDVAPMLASGRAEQTILWTDEASGVECKGRLDFVSAAGWIVDLKSTKDGSPDAFARSSWYMHYHAQAAFYSDGLAGEYGRLPYRIIAVEKTEPYAAQVYDVGPALLNAGRRTYRGWLAQLVECRRTGEWPAYAAGPLELSAPRWADTTGESDEDEEVE